jgi:hypothetical protein
MDTAFKDQTACCYCKLWYAVVHIPRGHDRGKLLLPEGNVSDDIRLDSFHVHALSLKQNLVSCDSLVVIATGYWQESPGSILTMQDFSLLHSTQAGSEAHPASYPMSTGGKAARAWNWLLTSTVELYRHSTGANLRLHLTFLSCNWFCLSWFHMWNKAKYLVRNIKRINIGNSNFRLLLLCYEYDLRTP